MREVEVVMRCRNERPYTARALRALAAQRGVRARVLFFDCGSTDGSREDALAAGAQLFEVTPATYMPGAVLNAGMRAAQGAVVAFVNADAIALHPHALEALCAPLFEEASAAASFGRQRARRESSAATRAEHARTFGPLAPVRLKSGGFFSMVASAVRRSAWEAQPFDETARYSEDVLWTTRAAARGWTVRYAPEALFEHAHDYDARAAWRRREGEGKAERKRAGSGAPGLWSDLLRPLGGALLRDLRAGVLSPEVALRRVAEKGGWYAGLRRGA